MIRQVFTKLGLTQYSIKINNRKIKQKKYKVFLCKQCVQFQFQNQK
jgi:histidyl-tRNA synthetase